MTFYNFISSYILDVWVYISVYLRYRMDHELPPYIKIGSGTRNFYTNLCRAYLKNHKQIRVIGGGYKISAALCIYRTLQKEVFVHDIQHICVHYYRMHSMCTFLVSNEEPNNFFTAVESNENEINIYGEETVSHITHRCKEKLKTVLEIHLNAVGQSCVKAFFVASQLAFLGYCSYVYPVKMSVDKNNSVKIKVYKAF